MRRRLLAVLLVAVALGGLALWATRSRGPEREPQVVQERSGELAEQPTQLATPAATKAAPEPARVTREPVAGLPEGSEAALSTDDAHIVVHVLSSETQEPVAGQRLFAVPEDPDARAQWTAQHIEESTGDLEHAPRTDAQGQALFVLPSGSYRVVCPRTGLFSLDPGEPVSDLLSGQRRELTFRVSTEPRSVFVGRIQDAATRQPVQEATLALSFLGRMSAPNDTLRRLQGQWAELRPDERGFFRGPTFGSTDLVVSISTPGYRPCTVTIEPGHETDERAALVLLHRLASLRARIQDEQGRALVGVELRLHPEQGAALVLFPEAYQDMGTSVPAARTDADGVAVLAGLAPGEPYLPELLRDGVSRTGFSVPIVLAAGEERELTWSLAGCAVTGQVLDLADASLAGQRVWIEPVSEWEGESSERFGPSAPVAMATTDGDGRFSFPGIPPGSWWVGLNVEDPFLASAELEDLLAMSAELPGTRVDIRGGEQAKHVLLRSPRGGPSIRGRVVDERGEPAASAFVLATGPMSARIQADESGSFELGPLFPGQYDLEADAGAAQATASSVPTGAEGLMLVVRTGSLIHGEVIEAGGTRGRAILSAIGSGFGLSSTPISPSGEFRISVDAPGLYGLVVQLDDGRAALQAPIEVKSEGSVGPLRIRIGTGARLRLLAAGPALDVVVRLDGFMVDYVSPFGASRDIVLPPGQCTVESFDGKILESFPLAAGEYRELVLGGSGSR